jgi:large subunit ribosomal protein L10
VVTAAKILTDFAKEKDKPRIRAGAIEGRVVSIDEIRRIAELPPRDQLLAQVVGYARAPIAGLVYTLNGLLSKFVRTVDALREQKEAGAGTAAPGAEPATSAGDDVETA